MIFCFEMIRSLETAEGIGNADGNNDDVDGGDESDEHGDHSHEDHNENNPGDQHGKNHWELK